MIEEDHREIVGEELLHAEMELTDTRSGECIWKQSISQPLHLARGGENPFGRAVVAGVAQTLFGQIGDGHRFDAPGHLIDIDSYTLLFSAIALMHRVTTIGAGTLDALPHNGTVLLLLQISGLTHRESYLDMVMTVIVTCTIALAAVLVLGTVFGSF